MRIVLTVACCLLALAASVVAQPGDARVTREKRAKAYQKLLEGERYLWRARSARSSLAQRVATRKAKEALEEAVALNPKLAEGYTALTEVVLRSPNLDVDEAISLSTIAVTLDPDNFGGHRYLGRLFTVKAGLGRGTRLNKDAAGKAIV